MKTNRKDGEGEEIFSYELTKSEAFWLRKYIKKYFANSANPYNPVSQPFLKLKIQIDKDLKKDD